jgi:hypothetical protein
MKKTFIIASAFVAFSGISAFAQQGIHSSGGNASGTGGSVSYSMGQVFYTQQTGSNGSLNQGVQQPYELVVTEVKNPVSALIKCEVFPNPTVKELNLRISGEKLEKGNWKLIDLRGVTLLQGELSNAETLIPMANQPMAAYTLQVLSEEKLVKTFKVIKQ